MKKQKEKVIHVVTLTDLDGVTKVTSVQEQSQMVYETSSSLWINHLDGKKTVYRTDKGRTVAVHATKRLRSLSLAEVMANLK